jgi:hypothetical protein
LEKLMKKATMVLSMTGVLFLGMSTLAADIPEHSWTCITLGESMPGTTCQICQATNEAGEPSGDSVICS